MNGKIKYAIIIYIILLILAVYNKPNLFKNNNKKCLIPCMIIILSIISYYSVSLFELFFK